MSERLSFAEMLKQTEQKNKTKLELVDPTKHNQTQDNQTKPNITKPDHSKHNQTKPKATQPNPTKTEVSPTKNFTKVPNSHTKKAIPGRVFRGLSKDTYDVLYHHTRGAINPTRTIQLNKRELMKLTGLSDNTVQTHIKYLKDSGLLFVHEQPGKHQGSIYEVFIWEELDHTQPNPTQADQTEPNQAKNLVPDQTQDIDLVGLGNRVENKENSPASKTFFNTNTENDDEARVSDVFGLMASRLDAAVQKITGKSSNKNESEKWAMLADLLILELEVAASRAGNVSSVPAFLTEVLRRQFFAARREPSKSSKKQSEKFVDTVGKSNVDGSAESFEIKPLDEKGREAALYDVREFVDHPELLEGFEKWYTPEDWQWIKSNLNAAD